MLLSLSFDVAQVIDFWVGTSCRIKILCVVFWRNILPLLSA